MRKILCAALIALAPFTARAVVDIYAGASASLGGSVTTMPGDLSNITNRANSFGAMVGADIPFFRIEGEYNYLMTQNLNIHAAMANAYFRFLPTPLMRPYVGVGLGTVLGGTVGDTGDISSQQNSMAYQGMAGMTFDLVGTPLLMDVEGRVFYAPNVYEAPMGIGDIGFMQYDLRAKLRYVF